MLEPTPPKLAGGVDELMARLKMEKNGKDEYPVETKENEQMKNKAIARSRELSLNKM